MKIYVSYVLRHLAVPTFFITLSLVCVVWLTQSLRFIDLIINQGLPVSEFLRLIVLLLPSLFGLVLPIAILCSALYTYNKLNYESEILVLRAAGVSRLGIARPAIILAVVVAMIGYFISLYALPVSYRNFKDLQNYFRDNYASLMLEEGIFNKPVEGLTIYISSRAADDTLKGILIHDNRVPLHPTTLIGESATAQRGANGLQFLMHNATRQQIDRDTGKISLLYFDSYPFDVDFFGQNKVDRGLKSDEMFVSQLLHPDPSLPKKQRNKQIADGHNRLIWPFYNFSLPMMILALMLSGDYNRRGQTKRIMTAVVLAIILISLGMTFKNIASDGKKFAIVLMYVPSALTVLFSLYIIVVAKVPFPRWWKRLDVPAPEIRIPHLDLKFGLQSRVH